MRLKLREILCLMFVAGLTFVHYLYETQCFKELPTAENEKNQNDEMKRCREAERRQVEIKSSMRKYCLKHKVQEKPSTNFESWRYFFVDDEFQILYCAIAKVGSTTLKRMLAKLHNKTFPDNYPYVHEWKQWKRLSQYSETERDFRLQTYFKFMFVREPLHRLLSAYKDKFTTLGNPKYSPHYREKIIKSYRPDDFKPGGENFISFAEFIKYYSKETNPDQHWRQYERLCHPCFVNYDFIGRLETLEEDGTLLLKMAGIDDHVTFPAVHKQTSSDEVLKYYSQVPPEDIIRIGKQYVSDFLLFGYDYLGPVKPLLNGTWPPGQ